MAVRRLLPDSSLGEGDVEEGAVELLWDDRSTLRIDAVGGRLALTRSPSCDPFPRSAGAASGALTAHAGGIWTDVSRSPRYNRLIGTALASARCDVAGVALDFGGARFEVVLRGVGLAATVTQPIEPRDWWRVEWCHDNDDEPVVLYHELVMLEERRKVEVWRDGRRGAASAYLEFGGSSPSVRPLPSLIEINADPQFAGEAITAERFQTEWQAALRGIPTTTLWRPTGPTELALVEESGWPPRLPDQPIFYPVTTREYAERIAREWNVPASGVGYVTRFDVASAFMDRYAVQQAGGSELTEWWVPAEELEDLNDHIVGPIVLVTEVRG